jgi:isopenicillin-N N-acyltransferase like protein
VSEEDAPTPKPPFFRRHRKKLIALGVFVALPFVAHCSVVLGTRMTPPSVPPVALGTPVTRADGVEELGRSYVRPRGKITEVRLVGSPEEIGHAHSTLLYDEMITSEGQLYRTLDELVPFKPFQWLIFDVARVAHAGADRAMSAARLREITAQARAFSPDPFESKFPTYQRLVYLNSLYDIALGFEHSPMMGCSSFAATGPRTRGGHTILARNFDFEAGSVYDEHKVVFLVFEEGKIPFASVAWPGLVGVLSGMNREGLSVVVHGGRARETTSEGEPVVHTTRALLAEAHDVTAAIELLRSRRAMVSHILMLADAKGRAVVVERAPGEEPFVREMEGDALPLTNHFEGPLAADPKNLRVREATSTLPRRARLDELLTDERPIDAARAVEILRDKKGAGASSLPFGHRSTLDAAIATHAVVMDSTDRTLWVSEGPHLLGRFLRFDLGRLLDADHEPSGAEPLVELPPDPAYVDGTYARWLETGGRHDGAE